jgi:hypothetical protein
MEYMVACFSRPEVGNDEGERERREEVSVVASRPFFKPFT